MEWLSPNNARNPEWEVIYFCLREFSLKPKPPLPSIKYFFKFCITVHRSAKYVSKKYNIYILMK